MALTSGARLGPYEIVSPLGAGGMGEVYKARDTRLDRTVAIKILSNADPELKARFEREARSIAALQHPHICTLHDVGDHEGTQYLVMEHLEGETLASRLERGRLKLDEALRLAVEIAGALDAAHRAGVVHRDLKPGNVMLTKSGAKLMDFGLAKPRSGGVVPGVSVAMTQAQPLTGAGTILGTLQYMAPEQLEGRDVDSRADIFAFGAVLYEMVTGRKAFDGKSQASVIAAILHIDPPPMTTLQPVTPTALDRTVTTCLAKDPDERWQTARDLLRELKWIGGGPSVQAATYPVTGTRSHRFAWTTAAALGFAAITSGVVTVRHLRETPPTRIPTRFSLTIPGTAPLFTGAGGGSLALALSPDGSHLAYVGGGVDRQLYLRAMDQLEVVPIRGTQGAIAPFFSPNGQWVGFFADAKLKKIPIVGGTAQTLAAVVGGALSGSWGSDDTIVFASGGELRRIRASGGKDEQVTVLNVRDGETSHRWVEILPGGKAVVFVAQAGNATQHRLMIHRLDTGETRMLDPDGVSPHYVSSGHLLFVRSGTLFAAPFDSKDLTFSGTPVPVLEGVATDGSGGVAHLAIAANGSLAYVPGDELVRSLKLVWVDRRGIVQPLIENPRPFREAHLSPDGERIAIGIEGSPRDLWIYEIKRGTLSRFTLESSESEFAAWTPDGKRIAFGALRLGRPRVIRWQAVDGSGGEEDLLPGGPQDHQHPASWSPDGQLLAFTNVSLTETGSDVWVFELSSKSAVPFAKTRFTEAAPMFSPDGRWIAYVSDESGHSEVYVQPYPGPGGKRQVSISGGGEAVWAPNGRELFYRVDDKLMSVPVTTQPTFTADAPRLLFEGRFEHPLNAFPNYDVARDGQRFLMFQATQTAQPQITVVLDWTTELSKRVPTKP